MDRSKLIRWCEGVIEAGWLAVLVLAPLYMNRFTNWNIEPDKVSLVRTIAVIMLGAYVVKVADSGSWWRSSNFVESDDETTGAASGFWHRPLLVPLLFYVVSFTVSTFFSITTDYSIWGGPGRSQGLITLAAYLVIGILLVAHLRSSVQLRRVQHAIILPTIPLAIHGWLQMMRWEPVPITGGVAQFRVEATSGNPDFLAAFFVIAAIVTVERLFSTYRASKLAEKDEDRDAPPRFAFALYGVVLLMQLGTIVLTQARGPWIGLAAGVFVFVLLVLFVTDGRKAKRYATIWTLGCGVLIAIMLMANVLPQFDRFRDEPFAGRLLSLLEHETGSGLVRVIIWEGSLDLMGSDQAVRVGADGFDSRHSVRPFFGYGPEAFGQVVGQYIPPGYNAVMRSTEVTDRAHNATINAFVTKGALGLVAYYVLYFALFYWAFAWLGFFEGRRDAWLLLAAWLFGALVLVVTFYLYDRSWRFVGLAIPLGVFAGTVGLVFCKGLRQTAAPTEWPRRLFMAGLTAALLAHFIEAQFGIATTATSVYFWSFIALLYVVGRYGVHPLPAGEPNEQDVRQKGRRPARSFLERLPHTAVVDGVVILSLPFIYVSNLDRTEGTLNVLVQGLFTRMEGAQPAFGVGLLLILISVLLFGYFHGRLLATDRTESERTGLLLYVGLMIGLWLTYGLVHAARLVPGAEGTVLDDQLQHVQGHFDVLLAFLVAWLLVAGWMVTGPSRGRNVPFIKHRVRTAMAAVVVAGLSIPTLRATALVPVHTDVLLDLAKKCTAQQDWACTIELSRRALLADRDHDQYAMSIASGLTEQAKQASREAGRLQINDFSDVLALNPTMVQSATQTELLLAADITLRHVQDVNPLQPEHFANVARLYRYWSSQLTSMRDRMRLQEAAADQYVAALRLKPAAAAYWQEYGQLLAGMGRGEQAVDAFRESVERNPTEDTYVLLARTLAQIGRSDEASDVAEEALALMPNNKSLRQRLLSLK